MGADTDFTIGRRKGAENGEVGGENGEAMEGAVVESGRGNDMEGRG